MTIFRFRLGSQSRFTYATVSHGLCAAALISCGLPAHSQADASRRLPSIGADGGIYLPSSAKTRSLYGSQWTSIGLGLGSIGAPSQQGDTGLDLQVLYSKHGDNSALIIPVGLEYSKGLGSPNQSVTPYVAVGADVVPNSIKSVPDHIDNKWRFAGGATAAIGLNFGNSAYAEARYRAVSHVQGIDLSGTAFTVGVRF